MKDKSDIEIKLNNLKTDSERSSNEISKKLLNLSGEVSKLSNSFISDDNPELDVDVSDLPQGVLEKIEKGKLIGQKNSLINPFLNSQIGKSTYSRNMYAIPVLLPGLHQQENETKERSFHPHGKWSLPFDHERKSRRRHLDD